MTSIEFQIYDWMEDHYIDPNENDDDEENQNNIGLFIIHTFGRTMDGRSVYAKITGFTPYFYIELPNAWSSQPSKKIELKLKQFKDYLISSNNKKIWTKFKSTLLDIKLVEAKKANGFTNDMEFKFARLIFNNSDGMKKFKYFLEENEIDFDFKKYKFKTYEANLPPMFRCFHHRKVTGCSWVETSDYNLIKKESRKESYCDIEINVDWKAINPIVKDTNAPLRIASFDIECYSHDGQFPQANRKLDKIIQIGITYTYLGQSEPYRQYIGCLDETVPFDNTTILKWFDNETDLVLDFKDELIKSDCDIITGYNIFYFDEKYIYDRADQILEIKDEMALISKLKKKYCKFKEMKLASSALGENLLRFWDTPGRVHIDLMKDIQKTFSLPCYKLDVVSSKFIRGEIKNISYLDNNIYELECNSVDDICLYDYIHLEIIKGYVSDEVGNKYKICNINKKDKKLQIIGDDILSEDLNLLKDNKDNKIFWSQAKDDIGPKEIFKYQKGTPSQRSEVAKYCIKDCKLVNLLMNKLEVITKNIEMANVCSVPLSYLFIRGQGIKIFSLCLKEFREQGYIFPVIKMQKIKLCIQCNVETKGYTCPKCKSKILEDVESDDWFEGAIVFDPVPTVDYEANVTKDFNSLYPSAIIQKNMSHETILEDDEYDNLPNVEYYNAQYVESDGTIEHRRYAKKNNKLGVIPSILDKLLKERKTVKKQMETETDPFKLKILDAKQLALKLTANSLYGQLGASTSPVCKRDIAACTTSTGREMLILGKKYDEEKLPWIINGMKKALYNNDDNKFNIFIENELKNTKGDYAISFINDLKKYLHEELHNKTIQPIVRYGDSVIGSTPILLRNKTTKLIQITPINMIGNIWDKMLDEGKETKESCELYDYEVWTEMGWTNVQRVIRHKLSSNKKLLNIITNTGCVVVTDEHSLLNENKDIIIPSNLQVNDTLLTSFPEIDNNIDYTFNDLKINEEIADFLGCFLVNGFYDNFKCYVKFETLILLNKYYVIMNRYFYDIKWVIYNNPNGIYYIYSVYEDKNEYKKFIKNIVKLMYQYNYKTVPQSILNSNKNIRKAFVCGMYNIKESEDLCGLKIIDINLTTLMSIYTLLRSLKFEVVIKNDDIYYHLKISNKIIKNSVLKIEEWNNYEEYVYDLTTDNHHFQAGLGNIIVHNTDSNFSCYRIRENVSSVGKQESLSLWKEIIKFSKYLIRPFIPDEYQNMWDELHDLYYCDDKIIDLKLPQPPKVKPLPTHWKNILPIEDRLKQLLKEYMEESFIPWLWTLQEIIIKQLPNMDYKLYQWAQHQLNKIRVVANDFTDDTVKSYSNHIKDNEGKLKKIYENVKKNKLDITIFDDEINILNKEINIKNKVYTELNEKKQIIESYISTFIVTILKDYWIQPWYDVNDNMLEYNVEFYKGGNSITDKRSLDLSMEIGKISGELIKRYLPFPHNFAYEKTFWPFLILCKKKYVGNKYETNPNKFKQDFMGIVLKRRDNAPIVKEICGGIIDILINKRDPISAKNFLIKCLDDMFENKYDIKYFIQSRTLKLKESYKDWTRIAHVYLAEKIALRDPGNKPQSGDRIEFVVVKVKNDTKKKLLQGEIIETPVYIKQNNLEIDYMFYMTNQIQNPVTQFLELVDKDIGLLFDKYKEKYSGIIKKEKIAKTSKKKIQSVKNTTKPEKVPRVSKKIIKVKNDNTDGTKKSKKGTKKNEIIEVQEEIVIDNIDDSKIKKTKKKKITEVVEVQEDIKPNNVEVQEEIVVDDSNIKKIKKKKIVEVQEDIKPNNVEVQEEIVIDNIDDSKIKKTKKKKIIEVVEE